jgi:5-methylcytosine-specific restriction endonuclease McrA
MRYIIARQYGGVIIERGVCTVCGDPCIICKDNTSSCCSGQVRRFPHGRIVKETQDNLRRKCPGKGLQKSILDEQNNKCFWCGREFGEYILSPNNIIRKLRPVWDHFIPYSYNGGNTRFVASCERCNLHKSSMVISATLTEDSLREYLKRKWNKGGWKDMKEVDSV